MLAYRALYFLLPLCIAVVVYLVLEKRARAMRDANSQGNSADARVG